MGYIKKIIFPLILIFAVFIFGCSNTAGQKSKEVDVNVGIEGLTAEFAKSAPPQRVFEESSFPILLRIRNKGAYSITDAEQSIYDSQGLISIAVENDYVTSLTLEKESRIIKGKSDNEVLFYVDGKTKINPKGDEILVALNAKTGKLDPK